MGSNSADLHRAVPWVRRAIVVAVLAVLLSPLVTNRDSFPVSTYPMYAGQRDREVVLATVTGVDAGGQRRELSLAAIARTDDPLIATALVAQAIAGGTAADLCAAIAPRVAAGIVTLEVVEERHDAVARTRDEASLLDRTVHARCPVAGSGQG